MKRMQLFEFEDQRWFPNGLRDLMTRFIVAMHKVLNTAPEIAKIADKAMKATATHKIFDLCSGDMGPMPMVSKHLEQTYGYSDLQITYSDLYPNRSAVARAEGSSVYLEEPVDAANAPATGALRTMICSFHHMTPATARAILKDAVEKREALLIFEMSDNSFPRWLWWSVLPINFLMTFFVTPLVRPFTFLQFVFTYPIPVLPFFIAWDGAVSNVRTYTKEDLAMLLNDVDSTGYSWEIDTIKGKGKYLYLLGTPQQT